MSSITSFRNASPYYNCFSKSSKRYNRSSIEYQSKLVIRNVKYFRFKSLKCIRYCDFDSDSDSSSSMIMRSQKPSGMIHELVADKLERLVSEFEALEKPIDRVKRLLHYATFLAPMDESARVSENRVAGCTVEVWLEVKMDDNGRMRFKADSDSEITKGFCSCLIWMLNGAEASEVLAVKIEDLAAMNLGPPIKAQSRVNTWQNVLISMQQRTSDLVSEKNGESP